MASSRNVENKDDVSESVKQHYERRRRKSNMPAESDQGGGGSNPPPLLLPAYAYAGGVHGGYRRQIRRGIRIAVNDLASTSGRAAVAPESARFDIRSERSPAICLRAKTLPTVS